MLTELLPGRIVKSSTLTAISTLWIRVPLVPVIVTVNDPVAAAFASITNVEVFELPEFRLIVVELSVTLRPGGVTVLVTCIVPTKPLTLVKVAVLFELVPAFRETVLGTALITKSCGGIITLTIKDSLWVPFVPVTLIE